MTDSDKVIGFVFDVKTGRPLSRAWQYELGGAHGIYQFFHVIDCQTTKPMQQSLVMGTAADWHRMGLHMARARNRKGKPRCVKPANG